MTNRALLAGFGVAVALVGCGKISSVPIPVEKTATDFATTICPKAYTCCTATQLMGNDAAGATEAECETKTAQSFRNQLQTMQASVNAGRAKYDQAQVDACLAALRQASCSELTMIHAISGLPACNATFATPMLTVGDACQQDYECLDSVCQRAPGSFVGVCAVGAPVGASCVSDHCAPSLLCDPRDGNDQTDSVCVVEQENGGACVDNFECKSRVCAAAAGATAKICMAPTTPQCFYGGGCSVPGGRPSVAALLLMGLCAAGALLQRRGARRRDARPRGARSPAPGIHCRRGRHNAGDVNACDAVN